MRKRTRALLGAGLLAAGAGAALRRKLMLIRVTGNSMAPMFTDSSRLLVRTSRRIRSNDVIVFRNPLGAADPELRWLVKRVAALPGEPVPADVLEKVGARPGAPVPAGRIVVRGDARRTLDSRHFGYVPAGAVLGVVVARLSA
ncbi:S26 family signal peptidase [Streptomyces sp. NEAU-Y11]|uniref:S26 family signal peptidase n=1 Tax=Streptomyces cucumeris TaxID=2962890 RepID=UPI0020C8A93C|nr:S26 family signal peptidase [Streptomyces sp. NEAU-Y11]MCP9208968.1 S26 family signal peptidase [Streptomyces sp. NEAU-Y11]